MLTFSTMPAGSTIKYMIGLCSKRSRNCSTVSLTSASLRIAVGSNGVSLSAPKQAGCNQRREKEGVNDGMQRMIDANQIHCKIAEGCRYGTGEHHREPEGIGAKDASSRS